MLHPTEPLFPHLERGDYDKRLMLGEPSKAKPTGRDSITPDTGVAQG